MTKKMERKLRRLTAKYLKAKSKMKEHAQAGEGLLNEIIALAPVGTVVQLASGEKATIVDNFAGKNVAFRPARIMRIDLKID